MLALSRLAAEAATAAALTSEYLAKEATEEAPLKRASDIRELEDSPSNKTAFDRDSF